jgi:hypothetical protein
MDAGYPKWIRTSDLEEGKVEPKERLKEQVDQRSTQAGEQVNTVADDVRSVAGELRNQGKDKPAQYAEQAAERVQSVGQWLERSDGDQILRDVEGFARRNPWAVAAGGMVLGLAASRFLKASSGERYRASLSNGTAPTGPTGQAGAPPVVGTPAVQPDRDFGGGGEFSRHEDSMVTSEPRV